MPVAQADGVRHSVILSLSAFPLMSSPSVWECSVLHAAKRALGSAHRRLHVCPLKLSDWHQGQAGSPSLLLLCHSLSLHHLHLTLPVSLTLSLSPCYIAPPPHLCMERKAPWSYVDYPCSFFTVALVFIPLLKVLALAGYSVYFYQIFLCFFLRTELCDLEQQG